MTAVGVGHLSSLPCLELLEVGQCKDAPKLLEGALQHPAFPALMAIELGSLASWKAGRLWEALARPQLKVLANSININTPEAQ